MLYNKRHLIRTWIKNNILTKIHILNKYYIEIDFYKNENEKLRSLISKRLLSRCDLYKSELLVISDNPEKFNSVEKVIDSSKYIYSDETGMQEVEGSLFDMFIEMNIKTVVINSKHHALIESISKVAKLISLELMFAEVKIDDENKIIDEFELDGVNIYNNSNVFLTKSNYLQLD